MNQTSLRASRAAARVRAHTDLTSAVAGVLDEGGIIPCLSTSAYLWTSDRPSEAREAALACEGCAAAAACREYIGHFRERAGVWAGSTPQERAQA